ncbi:unnamed protein product [Lathyrus sativus]|nr:unnamed protein product [Lathyrus sativus]
MRVRHVLDTGKYLGMPSMIGRSKEVMIKSVLQAIPSYIMSLLLSHTRFIMIFRRCSMLSGGEEEVIIGESIGWPGIS